MEQREFVVEQETAGQRIDRFLSGEDTGLSRSALQGLVAEGHVLCNGKAPAKSLKLKAGDIILLEIPDAKPIEAVPQEIPLDIIYEDAHLLVVNKPKGMVVHPAPGNPDGTLVNALLWHCKGSLSGIGGEIRPGIVHRIDKDTSGLLVVAKDDATHIGLSQQMAVHSVERAYQTVVYGGFAQDEGFVEANLGRSKTDRKKMAVYPASEPHTKYAYTGYKVLERFGGFPGEGDSFRYEDLEVTVLAMDGLRVDAIGNALYHCPNGWQAAEFFKTLTAGLHARFPGCMLVAEDSAGSMNATSDTASGGLGFDYVWEIGWTQDTLAYFAAPFGGRSALFRQLCGSFGPFGAVQGINALSHDENHPASIFTRLYGNVEEKLAQMRLLLLLQAARPGKSLLFAGVEFGQPDAFTDGREPNWAMLADAGHRALADYSKALNAFCLAHPALYAPQSFAWTAQDASTGVLGFTLQAGCETLLCALNTGTQAVQGFGLKPGWGSCALPLFAAGWVDNAPRPIANGWLALDLAPLSGGIWQIE